MTRSSTSSRARAVATALLLVAGMAGTALAPGEAAADPSQLCRSVANLALWPIDLGLSPIITAKDMFYGLTEISDDAAVRVGVAIPGYVYLNTVQAGGAVFRLVAGVYEFLPGIFTLFREGPTPPLYRAQDETWQLYSNDIGPCPIRIGSSYNTINEG